MLTATLSGSPFERGYQRGRQFAALLRQALDLYCPQRWLEAQEVKTLSRSLLASLADQAPDLLIELVGISRGADLSFEQIVLVNLVLATNDMGSDAISSTFTLACSALGFAASDAGPIVGKNCDERPEAAPVYILETVRPEGRMAYMCIGWAGTLWAEAGLNEAGLAVMQTAGPSAAGQDGSGIVCNIAPRLVLERCRTTQEAVAMFAQMVVAGWGMGAVIADANGDVATIEKTYDRQAVVPAIDGAAFCTNHFVSPDMAEMLPIAHEGIVPNSTARYHTLATLFGARGWPHTLAGLKSALGYHGPDGFVCQHGGAGLHSNYSCIAVPTSRQIWLGDGYPCQGNYSLHQL